MKVGEVEVEVFARYAGQEFPVGTVTVPVRIKPQKVREQLTEVLVSPTEEPGA
jgi:hypothetical protein